MDGKTYLKIRHKEISDLERQVIRERQRYAELRSRLTGSAATSDGQPSGGGGHGPENALCALVDLGAKINAEVNRKAELMMALDREIDAACTRPEHKDVLSLRYVDGLRWEEIARRTHYDRQYIYELHGYALREFGKNLSKT